MTFVSHPLFLTYLFAFLIITPWLIKLWNDPSMKNFHDVYNGVQKIHDGYTPRLGGVIFYCFLTLTVFSIDFDGSKLLQSTVLALIPTVFVTLIEDIFNNVKPKARLFSIIFSAALLVFMVDFQLPKIDVPLIMDFFISYPFILSIILVFSLATLANGFNLVDGANGLLYLCFTSILLAMLYLAYALNSIMFINVYSLLLLLTLCSLFFNYPSGKMFAGDLGAYCLGILVGFVTIVFFGKFENLITWYTLLILFYPIFELLFTMLRRYRQKKSIMSADTFHLHQIIYRHLNRRFSNKVANNLVVVILLPLLFFPFIWIILFGPFMNFGITWLGISLQGIIYISMYRWIRARDYV